MLQNVVKDDAGEATSQEEPPKVLVAVVLRLVVVARLQVEKKELPAESRRAAGAAALLSQGGCLLLPPGPGSNVEERFCGSDLSRACLCPRPWTSRHRLVIGPLQYCSLSDAEGGLQSLSLWQLRWSESSAMTCAPGNVATPLATPCPREAADAPAAAVLTFLGALSVESLPWAVPMTVLRGHMKVLVGEKLVRSCRSQRT